MDLKHFFKLIIFGDKESPKRYGLAFAFALGAFCVMALPSYLDTILPSHWWNTLGLSETSGQAILKQFEIEDDGKGSYFRLELVGFGGSPSLFYDQIEYGGRIDMWWSDVDHTCVDYGKVWDVLEGTD